jgi:hypothetical protein
MGTIGNARLQCQIPNDVGLAMNLSEKIGTELCVVPGTLCLFRTQ